MSSITELWKQFQGEKSPIPDLTPEAEALLKKFTPNLLYFSDEVVSREWITRHIGDVYCAIQDGGIAKEGVNWSRPCVFIIDQDDDWGVYRYLPENL